MTSPAPTTPPMPDPGPAAPPAPSPLTPEQLQEVQRATERGKKIRRAVNVAKTDGGITAFFAAICMLSFCMGIEGPILGVALGLVAFNSFRGARRLAKFDHDAPAILAFNQLYLAGAIILYALYELHAGLTGGSELTRQLTSAGIDAKDIGADVPRLEHMIYWALYGGLILGTIIFQGLTALYYHSRAKLLDEYLAQTPPWIVQLQAARS